MKVRDSVARLTEKQAKQALDDALTHLHWLTRGGEFADEIEINRGDIHAASLKEFDDAREWLDKFDKRRTHERGKNN